MKKTTKTHACASNEWTVIDDYSLPCRTHEQRTCERLTHTHTTHALHVFFFHSSFYASRLACLCFCFCSSLIHVCSVLSDRESRRLRLHDRRYGHCLHWGSGSVAFGICWWTVRCVTPLNRMPIGVFSVLLRLLSRAVIHHRRLSSFVVVVWYAFLMHFLLPFDFINICLCLSSAKCVWMCRKVTWPVCVNRTQLTCWIVDCEKLWIDGESDFVQFYWFCYLDASLLWEEDEVRIHRSIVGCLLLFWGSSVLLHGYILQKTLRQRINDILCLWAPQLATA